ncbi:MAG: DUF971 domain-containing protein [Caldilineaceae bacterium]|nr:DUF971 domain-containing protein [Caldilineaceae bacterium]MCB9140322.1 DUF971 domain-containing protein [Caldilineaceae bacterium]
MTGLDPRTRPQSITVDRPSAQLQIVWQDGKTSAYPLRWLRKYCPCATCGEERGAPNSDPLRLNAGPPPSTEIANAELVGNYAVRFDWTDGHGAGIYTFAALRSASEAGDFEPEKLPPGLGI